ncbi:helix-turn-helix domain-containing protein [Cyanobium sp. FACHB-13342]|uniref:helix-turn-helix domain-containing protein n=1 Tax=Cyanobium sp. FACHB-13342 TaxID=2692793 RepID=UPI001680C286|nr:helix-turn-helix domain-containing protein [Cyanobium sp. FACHB-13342]
MPDSPIPEPIPALRALGQVLRQGREAQGVGLGELADRLNMGQEQLLALEEGDAGRLPEPVFVIAQARRVANSLAIDVNGPLQALRDCDAFQASPLKVRELTPRPSQRPLGQNGAFPASGGERRPGVLSAQALQSMGQIALAAGILAAIIGGGSAGWQQLQRQPWLRQQVRPAQPPTTTTTTTTASTTTSSTPTKATPAKPTPAKPGRQDDQLLLRSRQPSWLEVKTATGTTLFRGTFQGERPFPLAGGLLVLAGRPDLVQAQLGSGPAQPLGPIDQVRWRRFKAPAP